MSPGEKRDAERIQILGELHGEVMVYEPMVIKEISRGGAQIESRFPLHVDSLHDFRLTLGDRSVVVKARVAHCSISDVDRELSLPVRHRIRRAIGTGGHRHPRVHRSHQDGATGSLKTGTRAT